MSVAGPSTQASLKEQDAKFRATIVGKSQVEIEQHLIASGNGVFILFTPDIGTPQMISTNGEIPDGLIPAARIESYDTSVKPRVETTHLMPSSGVRSVFIRHNLHRSRVDEENSCVDETHYKALVEANKETIKECLISPELYIAFREQDMPAAFYYYKPKGSDKPEFASIFGKQINSKVGNTLTDPGVYYNRDQDLEVVNKMLQSVDLCKVEELLPTKDLENFKVNSANDENTGKKSVQLKL